MRMIVEVEMFHLAEAGEQMSVEQEALQERRVPVVLEEQAVQAVFLVQYQNRTIN